MLDLAHLGPALRLLRQCRDLYQHEVARAAGVTKSMVSAYERGRRRPSLPTLVQLLNAIDADFATLQRAVRQAQRCGH